MRSNKSDHDTSPVCTHPTLYSLSMSELSTAVGAFPQEMCLEEGEVLTLRPSVKESRPQTTESVPEVAVYADMGWWDEFR